VSLTNGETLTSVSLRGINGFGLSGNGSLLAFGLCQLNCGIRIEGSAAGAPATIGSESPALVFPSPTGRYIASSQFNGQSETAGVVLYDGTTLVGAVGGYPLAWLSEDRLLVRSYGVVNGQVSFAMLIVNPQGVVVSRPPMTQVLLASVLANGAQIYSPELNTIFDVATGAPVWTTDRAFGWLGDADDDFVIHWDGRGMRVHTH
jgi:hypothetical protein